MASKPFLLEIGLEEVPARFVANMVSELEKKLYSACSKAGLFTEASKVENMATYRRFAVIISDMLLRQNDQELELDGPPLEIAKKDGEWQPAAIGFAKKCGVELHDLESVLQPKEDNKGRSILSAKINKKGKPAMDLLPSIIEEAVNSLSLPIAMRWGSNTSTFIRPVHWVACLLGNEVVPVTLFGQSAGSASRGHRFLRTNSHSVDAEPNVKHSGESGSQIKSGMTFSMGTEIDISSVENYESSLREAQVIASPQVRKEIIENALKNEGKQREWDSRLVEEVVYLTEQPTPLIGQFDTKYLDMPPEVLTSCMMSHQKYFPLFENNALSNRFLIIADNITPENSETILQGNERVLVARLEDVVFFWEEDRKKPIEEHLQPLSRVVFQKNLGTMADKVQRLENLSVAIAGLLEVSSDVTATIAKTAQLAKADLSSLMVIEMPALQGIMGEKYALAQGIAPEIASGIREHYLPAGESDTVPTALPSVTVGIADRLDTIVACYENGLKPTSSKDPWGVRRAMLAVAKLLIANNLNIDLNSAITLAYDILALQFPDERFKEAAQRSDLNAMFEGRIRQSFIDTGIPHDIADSVKHFVLSECSSAKQTADQLHQLRNENSDGLKRLVETAVRVKRLSENAQGGVVNAALLAAGIEQDAHNAHNKVSASPNIAALVTLSDTLHAYFEEILVMDENEAVKHNRLAFLNACNATYEALANFEAIQV